MLNTLKKWWKYWGAKLSSSFDEKADPKVQLEQAIREAQDQHKRLRDQATSVIANEKQAELQLNRALDDLEKVSANARQAVLMADEAAQAGDEAKSAEFVTAAESFANRMISLEGEVEGLKTLAFQAAEAADQAKAAVQQNSAALQSKLAERQKLLSQLDQAKMQEQMNSAMESLSVTVGEDVPTFNEIRDKIESRQAKASAGAELSGSSVEVKMLEVEQASINVEAQSRLEKIRSELGISTAPAATATPATSATSDTASTDSGSESKSESESESESSDAPDTGSTGTA